MAAISLGAPLILLGAVSLAYLRLSPGEHYLGIFRYDLFYYLANARELFENGNGLFYANPFSASFDGPRVHSHLQLLLFGWTWRLTGIELPGLWQLAQLLFSWTMFLALYQLLGCFFRGREQVRAFVVISLGGGTLALHALGLWAISDGPSYMDAFRYLKMDTKGPAWLPNVFQNGLYATEAFYHTLAFLTFAAAASGRVKASLAGVFFTWWSHPFTGLEVSAVVGAFALLEATIRRDRRYIAFAAGVAILSVGFLAHNVVLVPYWSIDDADIVTRWRHDEMLFRFSDAVAMWGVFLLGPLLLLYRRLRLLEPLQCASDRFLAVWLLVVATLILHDLFLPESVAAFQPLHFTRGYLFIPMAILCLRALPKLFQGWAPRRRKLAVALLVLIVFSDNIVYTLDVATWNSPPVLSPELVEVVAFMAAEEDPSLVLVDGRVPLLSKYLPIVTPHRVYLVSYFLTPFYPAKTEVVRQAAISDSPARALSRLGIAFVVGERLADLDFADDIAADRARLAFESGKYHVVELLLPKIAQAPGPPLALK